MRMTEPRHQHGLNGRIRRSSGELGLVPGQHLRIGRRVRRLHGVATARCRAERAIVAAVLCRPCDTSTT